MTRLHSAIALLSFSLIFYQLSLMQILSILQWYHFAFMIIALALLGFGASGTFLVLAGQRAVKNASAIMRQGAVITALAMPATVWLIQHEPFRFDSFLVLTELKHLPPLIMTCFLLLVPFLCGAIVIGLALRVHSNASGGLYAANLIGSGFGAAMLLFAMDLFLPQYLPVIAGLPVGVAAFLLTDRSASGRQKALPALGISVCVVFLLLPADLVPSQFKSISRTRLLPEAKVNREQNSRHGFVQVVTSAALRYAPGLSVRYTGQVHPLPAVFNDGDWYGIIPSQGTADSLSVLQQTTLDLPYAIRPQKSVLVLDARTGMEVWHAASSGADRITAVEPHHVVLSLLPRHDNAEIATRRGGRAVSWVETDGRSFLARDTARYDLLVLPLLDAFGGTSGVYSLREQYLLTTEALALMWDHLAPNGMIALSSWVDHPYRHPLKVLTLLVHTLQGHGIDDVRAHLVAVRSWGTMTFVLSRSPVTVAEVDRVRSFAKDRAFDPALLPDIADAERDHFNRLADRSLFAHLDTLLSRESAGFIANYEFAIAPPSDDSPYFSQFFRLNHVAQLNRLLGSDRRAFMEVGTIVLIVTFLQTIACAALLLLVPLFWSNVRSQGSTPLFLYFGALGLGYMFTEVVLIQRCVLYLGHPITSAAVVVGALLVFSGAGSLVSSRLFRGGLGLRSAAAVVSILLLIYQLFGDPILHTALALPYGSRVLVVLAMIFPLAVCMGIPFPLGLLSLSERGGGQIAWAWGVNGACSVVGAVLAALLAVQWGFPTVAVAAVGAYGIGAFAGRKV